VSYGYSLEDLLALLHGCAPAKVDAVALHRRRVEHGHLSVGLKIHCLGDGSQFSTLVEGLGGAQKILDINYYKHSHASLCLVLPPVGSARSAILLLECIEHFIGSPVFSNPKIQIQVCSPGRLDARRSALLAIGFYLGSDTLRRYTLGDLATSFAEHQRYPRGRRLVLYDAEGDFDRNFDWWKESGQHRVVEPQLPFENGRSDLLTGSGRGRSSERHAEQDAIAAGAGATGEGRAAGQDRISSAPRAAQRRSRLKLQPASDSIN
jgi:hypothetical protein